MECDVNYFISNYGEELDAASLMEPIIVEYLKILKLDTEIKEYHDYIRNVHRNAWSGGGFGVKGAVKGYFKAQMMNAGSAFLTSFSDTKEFNNNMQEVRKAKAELFAREETKQCVVESVLRIYTVCYTIALNKLKNADIIDGTFFNTNKSDSIMNNVYNYLNNGEESEIDSEWLVDSCLQAFLEDPTSEESIYLLVRLLGENRMEPKTGIILYAKEYGFWNTYIDQRIDEVAEECENDINDFVKLAELPNENAEAVSKTIDSFHNLKYKFMLSGIFTNWNQVLNKLHFDLYLKAAVEKNLKYDKSLDEKEKVLEKVKSARDDEFDEHNQEATDTFKFYNSVIEKIEKTREIDYDRKNLLDLVERVCKSHSNDNDCTKANGFYFWNLYNIKQHEDFKYFNNAVNLPNECKIYLLCGKMQYNPKVPKYVIAITEYGMYVYQKRTDEFEGIQLFYSWHNLDNLKFEVCPEGGIYIGGKLFKYYTWELVHIVSDLRRQIKEFLENPTQYSDDEQNTTVKEDKNTEQFSENTVEQNEKARKCIVAAIDQFAQGWSNRENFVLKDDLRELEASNRPYTEKGCAENDLAEYQKTNEEYQRGIYASIKSPLYIMDEKIHINYYYKVKTNYDFYRYDELIDEMSKVEFNQAKYVYADYILQQFHFKVSEIEKYFCSYEPKGEIAVKLRKCLSPYLDQKITKEDLNDLAERLLKILPDPRTDKRSDRNIGIVSINKAIKPYGYVVESKKKTVPVSYMITLTDEGKEQEANV